MEIIDVGLKFKWKIFRNQVLWIQIKIFGKIKENFEIKLQIIRKIKRNGIVLSGNIYKIFL